MKKISAYFEKDYLQKQVVSCNICNGKPETFEKNVNDFKIAFCKTCELMIKYQKIENAVFKDGKWLYANEVFDEQPEYFINNAYHVDTFEAIKKISDSSIDLIHEDIPYGVGYVSNMAKEGTKHKIKKIANDKDLLWLPEHLEQCYRILKPDRHIFIYCSDEVDFVRAEMSKHFDKIETLIWNKGGGTGMGDLKATFQRNTEYIIAGQKGRRAFTNGKRLNNVLNYRYNKADFTEHPTPKPEALVADLIRHTTYENEVVFDGFSGRGVSAIACIKLKRNFIVFEKDEEHIATTRKNIELTRNGHSNVSKVKKVDTMQLGLFGDEK